MYLRSKLFFIAILICSRTSLAFGQSVAHKDTIALDASVSTVILSHAPIIESSVQCFYQGNWFTNYSIDPIKGHLILSEPLDGDLVVSYQSQSIPLTVGPLYTYLPFLAEDSLVQKKIDHTQIRPTSSQELLVSSGTLFRSIGISPLGGNDFSGGLQFLVQGQLGDDLFLNGVLTDRDIPIQPEGNTQTLDELDKVYIEVTHPHFSVEAGDVDLQFNSGKYLTVDRKLTGLLTKFHSEQWSSQAVFAGSEGEFNTIEQKGEDGRQGPYFLTSRTGNRDIIVLAGTEKIYLNGKLLTRGENHDYIIDYSRSELTFNPRHIIHSDADIYMEYQYSDFNYSRNILGSQVSYENENQQITFSWLREQDNFSTELQQIPSETVQLLKSSGDSTITTQTGILDSNGKYVLIDGHYVYWDLNPDTSLDRYSVSFHFDGINGAYAKKISDTGKLYFEYVNVEMRTGTMDLYSPGKRLIAPQTEEIFHVIGQSNGGKYITVSGELGLSNYDKNQLSTRDDEDNRGIGYKGKINGQELPLLRKINWDYSFLIWGRTKDFHQLARDREANFSRKWNTFGTWTPAKEQLIDGQLKIHHDENNLELGKSDYLQGKNQKKRWYSRGQYGSKWVPLLMGNYNRVEQKSSLYEQWESEMKVLPGDWHPFIGIQWEHDHSRSKYVWQTAGIDMEKNEIKSMIKIGKRTDYANLDTSTAVLDTVSSGLFGELDVSKSSRSGWSGNMQLRKRVVDYFQTDQPSLNYSMMNINGRYNNASSPIKVEITLRSEQTFTEQRGLVYDSVGTGLGQYRYDPIYNEYIPDPNGSYIAYTAFIGDRKPITQIESLSRFRINGAQLTTDFLKAYSSLTEIDLKYNGAESGFPSFNSKLSSPNVSRESWQIRQEITYSDYQSRRRIQGRYRQKSDLIGTDPRGNDLRSFTLSSIEWQEPLNNDWRWIQRGENHFYENTSTFSQSRNRTVTGWWIEGGPQWEGNRDWIMKYFLSYGHDSGDQLVGDYTINFWGMRWDITRYFKTSNRLQLTMDWTKTDKSDLISIPPEANRGLPLGKSLKFSLFSEIRIGSNLSIYSTLLVIDNARYTNFISFNGEVRAYF